MIAAEPYAGGAEIVLTSASGIFSVESQRTWDLWHNIFKTCASELQAVLVYL